MSFLGTTGSSLICPSACQPATGPAIPHRPRALCLSQLSPFPTLFLTFLEIPFIHHTLSLCLLWVHIANNNFLMHKARPPKKMFFPTLVNLPAQSPVLNLNQSLWDELEHNLWARPHYPTSLLDLTDALVSEWAQIFAARFQNRSSRGCYSIRVMPMIWKWHVHLLRCPYTVLLANECVYTTYNMYTQ